jgi:hypothetical protein
MHTLTPENIAFHLALGTYAGLRFGSDFKPKRILPSIGIALAVYGILWALFGILGSTVEISGADRAAALGALAGCSMLGTLLLYEAYNVHVADKALKQPVDSKLPDAFRIVQPALESDAWTQSEHWIDAHEQKLIAQNGSTAGMVAAAEWACRAWEHEAVRLYRILRRNVNDDLRAVLDRSQGEWAKLRQSDILFSDLVYSKKQGSMHAPMQVAARGEIARDRALRLQHRLELLDLWIPEIAVSDVPATPKTEEQFLPDNDIPGNGGNLN